MLAPVLAEIHDLMIHDRPEQPIVEFFTTISDSAPPPTTFEPIARILAHRATGLVADVDA
ncbi:hypothetical protein [Nocardia sp. NPDC059228]|uniref:hypothetical protein n=1 Tax=Nocardia sp. NPDC059228 TaxID=3346777 RepID=UPI0036C87E56